jgi:2-methylcitrate dehydratase PrpD
MGAVRKSPITTYRERMRRKGFTRVEVRVRAQDAALVREVASALGDPERAEETRALLQKQVATHPVKSFKDHLASAPLEGIEITRDRDIGRQISF